MKSWLSAFKVPETRGGHRRATAAKKEEETKGLLCWWMGEEGREGGREGKEGGMININSRAD